jgi:hypothetical protein
MTRPARATLIAASAIGLGAAGVGAGAGLYAARGPASPTKPCCVFSGPGRCSPSLPCA